MLKAVVVPTWPAEPDAEICRPPSEPCWRPCIPKQLVGVYDAFGGNDEPIDAVADQLRSQGSEASLQYRCASKQLPQGSDYQRCEESGTDLGQLLTKEKTIAAMKSLDGDLDKALGSHQRSASTW